MTPAQDLFRLIQSLSMSEKRYFKLFYNSQAGKEGKNYKKLFDAIARQKKYDERSIRQALKGQIKSFSNTKHNLYHLILRYLRLYHARSSASRRLNEMLDNIEILFDKGLLPECARMVKQAQRVAVLYDKDLILVELLSWEARLVREKTTKQCLNKIAQQEISLLEKQKSISEYRNIDNQYHRIHVQYVHARNDTVKKQFHSVMNPSLPGKKKLSREATIYIHQACAIYFRTIGDLNKSYKHCKRMIRIIESFSPLQLMERQKQYLDALFDMSTALLELRRYKQADDIVGKINAISAKNEYIALTIFYYSYGIECEILLSAGQFEKAVQLVKEVEAGLKRFKGKISSGRYITFCYAIAYSYFGAGNYSNTIEWSNKIINMAETDHRMDLHSVARLLNLMAHIEKGNWDFAGHYLNKSIRKFLEKNKRIYRFENILLEFVNKKLSGISRLRQGATSAQTVSETFKELKPQAEKIMQNPFERRILNYIDFTNWIESKIQNRPFAEIVREKAKLH